MKIQNTLAAEINQMYKMYEFKMNSKLSEMNVIGTDAMKNHKFFLNQKSKK